MRAFTLIELIIVLVIIGIVAAVGLPGINKARLDAEIESKRAFAVQLQTAKLAFIDSVGRENAATQWSSNSTDELRYDNLLKDYLPPSAPADLSLMFPSTAGYTISLGATIDTVVTLTVNYPLVNTNIPLYKY